jgi:hypothetical protein
MYIGILQIVKYVFSLLGKFVQFEHCSNHFRTLQLEIGLALTALRSCSSLFLVELVAGVEAVEIENGIQHVAIQRKKQELKVLDAILTAT